MEYKILSYSDAIVLEELVKEHLKLGWKCQGGIAITMRHSGGVWYAQAMIKE